jgi:alpha-tubulin suppressor-like RCC1 family protein
MMRARSRWTSPLVVILVASAGAVVVLTAPGCVGDSADAPSTPTDDGGPAADVATTPDSPTGAPDGGGSDAATCERCGGEACVDLTSDPKSCGACGESCTSDAGVAFACVASKCGNEVVQVASGFTSNCVVLLEGSLWCWGSQSAGELGTVDPTPQPIPTKIAITDVAEARLGENFVCARKRDGSVWCWGSNVFGVLGHAPGTDPGCSGSCAPTPTKIAFPGNVKIAQLSAGYGTVCARTEGTNGGDVYCWGNAFGGITGDASVALGAIQPTPTKISVFAGDVLEVSVSSHDTGGPGDRPMACALRNDKTVWCWGVNHSGGLGHAGGTEGDVTCTAVAAMPCNGTPKRAGTLTNVTSVSTGGTFACAVTQTGAVSCWGNNSNGYLGSSNTTSTPVPTQVSGLNTSITVASSDLSVVTVDSASGVKSWGANGHGQLALGNYAGAVCASYACFTSAQNATALQGAKLLSMTYLTGIALKTDGSIVTWGANGGAQLGHAPNTNGDTTCGAGSGACNPTPAPLPNTPWRW